MIKVEVIEEFTLKDFNKLKNIERKNMKEQGRLYVGDVFECDKTMADYLLGDNPLKKPVVKVLEIEPLKSETEPFGEPIFKEEDIVKDIAKKELEKTFDAIGEITNKKIEIVETKPILETKDEELVVPLDDEINKKVSKAIRNSIVHGTSEKKKK